MGRKIKTQGTNLSKIENISRNNKQVIAKKLILTGYSCKRVGEVLNIDPQTALNYSKKPTTKEQEEFSTIFDNYINIKKLKGLNSVIDRLSTLVPKEKRISEVVKAGNFFEGKKDAQNAPAFTINVKNLDISGNPIKPPEQEAIEGEEG